AADQRGAIARAEGWTVSFSEYFAAQADHIQQITQLPVFTKVIMPLDELYRLSLDLVPPSSKPHFGRFLLVCHKAFMSAASTIARGQPDDSQGGVQDCLPVVGHRFSASMRRGEVEPTTLLKARPIADDVLERTDLP